MNEAILSEYDFIAVIDTSGSMAEPVKAGSDISRWNYMRESLMTFIRDIEKIDSDGIDVVQLGGSCEVWTGVTSGKISEVLNGLSPRGGTPLHDALKQAFSLAGRSPKKDFIVVYTDGVPDDPTAVAKVIRDQTQKMNEDSELTILFVQVGDDKSATAYLKGLDDNLKGAKFDIVDAKTVEEVDKFATTADLIVAAISD